MRSALWGAALVAALGCGGSEPEPQAVAPAPEAAGAERPAAAEAGNHPPVIRDIRFEPEVPAPGHPVEARVVAHDDDGDELLLDYAWEIDGREVGGPDAGEKLDLTGATKGQWVRLTVVAKDGKSQSEPYWESFQLENRPPRIEDVDVEPASQVVEPGSPVTVFPSGSDPDGDALTYRYEWSVNERRLREEGARLDTKSMRRGDEIRVRVVASDGDADSEAVEPPPIAVVNAAPRVVSTPPADLADGVFRYPVVAQDPDGDTHVEFRLEGAPSGMQIDPWSGLITWEPSPEQVGVHTVTVLAEDLNDGVGEQVFEVRVSRPADAEGALPAAAE